jgi:hypothetical protein
MAGPAFTQAAPASLGCKSTAGQPLSQSASRQDKIPILLFVSPTKRNVEGEGNINGRRPAAAVGPNGTTHRRRSHQTLTSAQERPMRQWLANVRTRIQQRRQKQAHLHVEALEQRDLMSVTPLTWTAPAGNNSITLTVANSTIEVLDNNQLVASQALASTSSVCLTGATTAKNSFNIPMTPAGIATTINLKSSTDWVAVGDSNTGAQNIQGALTINGAGGSDSVLVNDQADRAPVPATIGSSGITGLAPAAINFSGLAQLTVESSAYAGSNYTITGTPGTTNFYESSGHASVTVRSTVGNVSVFGVGSDVVNLYGGSAGANTFTAYPSVASLKASGYVDQAFSFATVEAYSTTSMDTALLLGANTGTNHFTAQPASSSMTGAGYDNIANNFVNVHAQSYSRSDRADLYGAWTSGNTFYATSTYAQMVGSGYSYLATSFQHVTGHSNSATDIAYLIGPSSGTNTFTTSPTDATLQGSGYANEASRFEIVDGISYASGDSAQLSGLDRGTNTFTAAPKYATLSEGGSINYLSGFQAQSAGAYLIYASGFQTISALSNSISDVAVVQGAGSGTNTFTASPTSAQFTGSGYSLRASSFAKVTATSKSPGNDVANLSGANTGSNTFSDTAPNAGQPSDGTVTGSGYSLEAIGFGSVQNTSNSAGDVATLIGATTGTNMFYASSPRSRQPAYADIYNSNYTFILTGCPNVTGISRNGAGDYAYLHGADSGSNIFYASPSVAYVQGNGYFSRASGFQHVSGYSHAANDVAYLYGSTNSPNHYSVTSGENSMSGTGFSLNAYNFAQVHAYGQMVGWFQQNLKDPVVRSVASADFTRDGALTYAGMMDTFDAILKLPTGQSSESLYTLNTGAAPTAAQMQDLQTLINNGNLLNMPAYVQYLTNQVIHPGPDDRKAFGNMLAFLATPTQFNLGVYLPGNPEGKLPVAAATPEQKQSWQMQYLINEWFLGGEPAQQGFKTPKPGPADALDGKKNGSLNVAASPYSVPGGNLSLYGPAGVPVVTDVNQGQLGDCQLMASLAEVAYRDPDAIESMFSDNHNGSYTVRLFNYNTHQPIYITVNDELPNGGGNFAQVANGVLWPALAEKAMAQWDGSSYQQLSGDIVGLKGALDWMKMITDRSGDGGDFGYVWSSHAGDLANELAQGALVCIGTSGNFAIIGPEGPGVADNHEYAVLSYNPATDQFLLYNPWGIGSVTNITADVAATDTTVQVSSTQAIAKGDVIQIDGEQMLVTNVAKNSLTVVRGFDHTTAATHSGSGVSLVFYSNSPFAGTPILSTNSAEPSAYGMFTENGDFLDHNFNYWSYARNPHGPGAPNVPGTDLAHGARATAPASEVSMFSPVEALSPDFSKSGSAAWAGDSSAVVVPVAAAQRDGQVQKFSSVGAEAQDDHATSDALFVQDNSFSWWGI